MSEKTAHYVRMAEEAERQALGATQSDERAAYEQIAALWRDLAATRQRLTPEPDKSHKD